jgi:hypothetical protein
VPLFGGNYGTIRVEKWLFDKVEDIDAPFLLILGGMVLEDGVDMEVEVVAAEGLVDEVFEEKEGGLCRISTGIDGDSPAFERGKEVRNQMGGRGIGEPDGLREKL